MTRKNLYLADVAGPSQDDAEPQQSKCAYRKVCVLATVGSLLTAGAGIGIGFLVFTQINSISDESELPNNVQINEGSSSVENDLYSEDIAIQNDAHQTDIDKTSQEKKRCGTLGMGVNSGLERMKGKTAMGKIVGGVKSSILSYPWQVSLWTASGHTCGGSLIASNWVLTAAHCTDPYPHTTDWTVFAGATYLSEMLEQSGDTQKALLSQVIPHPDFDPQTFDNDLALMRLDRHLSFNDAVTSICLSKPDTRLAHETECLISGWGVTEEGGDMPSLLQEAKVKILDTKKCNQPDWLMNMVSDVMICAGTEDGSLDACQGDSGGPLSCYTSTDDNFFLAGAVSWGIGCGQAKFPGVYTDLAKFNSWIVNQISS